jgi:hypothetical protein
MNSKFLLIDDDGSVFATEDGSFLYFGESNPISSKSPHALEKSIHSSQNWNIELATFFRQELLDLINLLPITNSQNFHAISSATREFNRKSHQFGLISSIIEPHDAGFRPSSLGLDSLSDNFLLLENGSFMLKEDGFELIL